MASEWEPFKDEIIVLYLVDGLTLNEVSSKMVQLHGFDKRKHQYEYMLKKWRIGKNTKKEVWEYVDHKVQKRQKQQKESEVRLHSIVLSDSRVRKAMQRYGRRSLAAKYLGVPSPQSPDNTLIDIRTPPGLQKQFDRFEWPKNLPWTQFSGRLSLIHIQLPESLMESMIRALATCSIDFESKGPDETDLAVAAALRQPLSWQAVVNSTLPKFSDRTKESAMSPSSKPKCIAATQVFQNLSFQISNMKVNLRNYPIAQNMIKLIRGLCQEAPGTIDHLLDSTDPTSDAIKGVFFAVIVRFGQSSLVAKFLAAGTNPNILIKNDIGIAKTLHRGKASFTFHQHCSPVTALQFACAAGDFLTASVLLQYQARPDFGTPTPLQILCSSTPSLDGLQLAKVLLQHGARLDTYTYQEDINWPPPLICAVSRGNKDMVRLLLHYGATVQTVVHSDKSFCYYTLWPSHLAFEFPQDIYPDTQVGRARLNLYAPTLSVSALQIAIIMNDSDIIDLLLLAARGSNKETDIYGRGLATACLTADASLVCRLLNLDTALRTDKIWVHAAFCAAAWNLDCKIARLLVEHGLIPQWQEGFCVSAGQIAALHGNHAFLKILHTCGYDINVSSAFPFSREETFFGGDGAFEHLQPHAWQPLDCALRLKHGQTAHTLLQLGATVVDSTLILALVFGTDELVLNMLERDSTVLEEPTKLLQIAVQEGKGLAVIRKIVDAGASFKGDELIVAVRKHSTDVVEYLLNFGLDIRASNAKGETVLDAAACAGNLDMMHKYFECGGSYNSKALLWAVIRAIATSENRTVEFLIEHRPRGPMDAYEATSFVQSILQKRSILIDIFLHLAADTGTSYFCWHGPGKHLEIERSFKSEWPNFYSMKICGHRPCHGKISPLWAAAHMHQETLLENMINRKFSPDAFLLKSALYNSTFASREMREQLATAYPISLITDEAVRRRLLVEAILSKAGSKLIREHIDSVDCLEFASYNECGKGDGTPLQLAATVNNVDCVRALLEAGAEVNAPVTTHSPYYQNKTALQNAVVCGDYDITTLLLKKGADVNASAFWAYGYTAIEIAAWDGKMDMTGLLLPRATLHGHLRIHLIRAVHFAQQAGHQAIVKLLKRHGGWTDEDSELLTTDRASNRRHTCPRYLYADETRDEYCGFCNSPVASETSSMATSTYSQDDESSVLSVAAMTEIDDQSIDSGSSLPGEYSTMLLEPFEGLGFGAMETVEEMDYGAMEGFEGLSFGAMETVEEMDYGAIESFEGSGFGAMEIVEEMDYGATGSFEELGNGPIEVVEAFFSPYDFTTTCLDDLPEGYFDSLI